MFKYYKVSNRCFLMNQPPKFGWGWGAHTSIETAAFSMMPKSSFKKTLEDNLMAINRLSVDCDVYNAGPKHFLGLEKMSPNHTSFYNPWRHGFKGVEKAHLEYQMLQEPDSAEWTKGENVFNETMTLYKKLVAQLKQIGQSGKLPKQKESALLETVASLSHYAADLTQPMHTTEFYDWNIPSDEANRALSLRLKDLLPAVGNVLRGVARVQDQR